MRCFYTPVVSGESLDYLTREIGREVRRMALERFEDDEYVTRMMDGNGYIEFRYASCVMRYIQD